MKSKIIIALMLFSVNGMIAMIILNSYRSKNLKPHRLDGIHLIRDDARLIIQADPR